MSRTLAKTAACAFILSGLCAPASLAQPYIGEITAFAGPNCPLGWTAANGELLPHSGLGALYSLIGNRYGGSTAYEFNVPNLNGRMAASAGHGPGLTPRDLAETFGENSVTLEAANLPEHNHALYASRSGPDTRSLDGAVPATFPPGQSSYAAASGMTEAMRQGSIAPAGQGQPLDIRQPYAAVTWCIAVSGLYPPRP